jgi:hypothetical protein
MDTDLSLGQSHLRQSVSSVGNSCRASSSAISDRLEGKKMSGKKMKIGSGAIATPTSFFARPIFLPHMFLPSMQWRKSLDSVSPDSNRPRRPMISTADGTEANQLIRPTMLPPIIDRADHAHRLDRATSSMPEPIKYYRVTRVVFEFYPGSPGL